MTPSTSRAYARHWQTFADFCREHNFDLHRPVTSSLVSLFVANLFCKGYKPQTIRSYTSGIGFVLRLLECPDPTSSFLVRKSLVGIQALSAPGVGKAPITLPILVRLLDSVSSLTFCPYSRALYRAVFLLMFYSCMRVGEAVVSTHARHTLTFSSVTPVGSPPRSFLIHFHSYKHSDGLTPSFILSSRPGDRYCPVLALSRYLALRGTAPGYLFLTLHGNPLTRSVFHAFLHRCVLYNDLDPGIYGTHSFRVGRATQLSMDRVESSVIKRTGRWKSDAFLRYMREPTIPLP